MQVEFEQEVYIFLGSVGNNQDHNNSIMSLFLHLEYQQDQQQSNAHHQNKEFQIQNHHVH